MKIKFHGWKSTPSVNSLVLDALKIYPRAHWSWDSQFLHKGQRFPSKPNFFMKMQKHPKRRQRRKTTSTIIVITPIEVDGLFVCTSVGGGDSTEIRGGTWRSVIIIILCNDIVIQHLNTKEGSTEGKRMKRKTNFTTN